MTNNLLAENKAKLFWGIAGAIISSIAGALCCIAPLILLFLGVSGVWIGSLTALEAYRPLFLIFSFLFLGFSFYRAYGKAGKRSCSSENPCSDPASKGIQKIMVWISAILVVGLMVFPYLAPYVFAEEQRKNNVKTEKVLLSVKGMTCTSCTVVVKKSIKKLEGIKDVKVTYNPSEALIIFNPDKLKINDLINATTDAGFPSSVKKKEKP